MKSIFKLVIVLGFLSSCSFLSREYPAPEKKSYPKIKIGKNRTKEEVAHSAKVVQQVIRDGHDSIKGCYEKRFLSKWPNSSDFQVRAHFVLSNYAGAEIVKYEYINKLSPEGQKIMNKCIETYFYELSWPKISDGESVPISYPFTFRRTRSQK
jgi:hypothetical protein